MVTKVTTKNLITYKRLIRDGYEPHKVVAFLLDSQGIKKNDIAKSCNVSPQYVTMTVSGRRTCQKINNAISNALGFDPWDME